jgi:hypothetical protein
MALPEQGSTDQPKSLEDILKEDKPSGGEAQTITLSGISDPVTFGTAQLNLKILLSGFQDAVTFGATVLKYAQTVTLSGIQDAVTFGSTIVRRASLGVSMVVKLLLLKRFIHRR